MICHLINFYGYRSFKYNLNHLRKMILFMICHLINGAALHENTF